VETLSHLLAVLTSPVHEQDRAQIKDLCLEGQEATGARVEVAVADQGDTGQNTARQAAEGGVELVVVKR